MCNIENSQLIKAMKSIADIPEAELHYFQCLFKPMELKQGNFFINAGQVPKYVGFNQSGLLRLYYTHESGSEFTKHFCIENTFIISFGAYLENRASRFHAEALEDTRLLIADIHAYRKLLLRHPCWQMVGRKMAESLFLAKEKRESEFLLDDAKDRYIRFLKDFPDLENRTKQYHIASYLGITPESLSRIRKMLKN